MSSTLQLDAEWRRQLCVENMETPSFVEKLLRGNWDADDRELGVSLGGLAFFQVKESPKKTW